MKLSTFGAVLILSAVTGCIHHRPQTVVEQPARVESSNPYRNPMLSVGSKFGGLPPAVQNTIRVQAGSGEIRDVIKDSSSGAVVYKIYFRNEDIFPPLYIAPDGSVLNADRTVALAAPQESIGVATGPLSGLKLSDLPPKVVSVIHDRAPNTEVARIEKHTRGEGLVYIVSFKDETQYPKMTIAPDGTVITETQK